jgi:hypothetical protein
MNILEEEEFALGYYYGRAFGSLPEDDYPDTSLFRSGFDAGIRDYCLLDMNTRVDTE